jgi:hypothetical protein
MRLPDSETEITKPLVNRRGAARWNQDRTTPDPFNRLFRPRGLSVILREPPDLQVPVKAVIYARVSTLDQEHENQLEELRTTSRRAWTAADEYLHVGVSGSKDRRTALDRLVSDAKRRKFDAVVVVCWCRTALNSTMKTPLRHPR